MSRIYRFGVQNLGRLGRAALISLSALPPALILLAIFHTRPLPDLDYWYTLERFTNENGLAIDYKFLTLHSNEHLIPFAGLLYVLNILLTHGSNLGLSLIAWSMGILQVFVLAALLPERCKSTPAIKYLWWFIISLFIFTPAALHNWLRGMSGTCWITANAMSIVALFFLVKLSKEFSWLRVIACAVFGVLAATSYSTGLMVWPILGLGALVMARRDWRPLAVLTATVIPLIALVVLSAERPAHHPAPDLGLTLTQHGEFLVSMLGNIVGSATAGSFVLLIAVVALAWAARSRTRDDWAQLWPWALLLSYPLTNGVIAAIFRSQAFNGAAEASRYASLSAIFILTALVISADAIARSYRSILGVVTVSGIIIGLIPFFTQQDFLARQLAYQERKKLAQLSLRLGVPDKALVLQVAMRDPKRFSDLLPKLKLIEHVPFEPQGEYCPDSGRVLIEGLIDDPARDGSSTVERAEGSRYRTMRIRSTETRTLIGDTKGLRISGFITPPVMNQRCLVVVDKNGQITGRVTLLRSWRDVNDSQTSNRVEKDSPNKPHRFWSGYITRLDPVPPFRLVALKNALREGNDLYPISAQGVSAPFLIPAQSRK